MSGLTVDADLCIGCGKCVRACASDGIVVTGARGARKAHPTENCILCASCVDACPVGAISIERDEAAGADAVDLASYHGIWVFAQVGDDGQVLPVAYELLGRARELAAERGCSVTAVLGEGVAADEANARALIAAGADEVLRCHDDRLLTPDAEVFARLLCDLVHERRPEIVLYGATDFGRALAPGVAVRLGTGLTADCTVLGIDGETGLLQQTRPAFGGNLMATIVCPGHRPQMATVRPDVFAAAAPDEGRSGAVTDVVLADDAASRVRLLARDRSDADDSITDAEALVVVGRGIGSKKNLPLMRHLAELLGGKLACTRPLVESGWLDYSHQVGQTGVSVAPKLMLSLGVSGAIQHLAGIGGAETIVAVNEDAAAPIMSVAGYQVVGDCVAFARELISHLESR